MRERIHRFRRQGGGKGCASLAIGRPLQQSRGKGLQGATANISTLRTIHENQSFEIVSVRMLRTTGKESTGILALFATLPGG